MMSDLVLTETRGASAILTLNRPEKLNALNYALSTGWFSCSTRLKVTAIYAPSF
jgi:enoyl-CoA hydratase/carnithine racemase